MNKFIKEKGLVLPLDRANVDTDFIIPKQFLKSIKRTGFGVNLFDEHRYLDKGLPDADNSNRPLNPDFVLNQPRYQGALESCWLKTILAAAPVESTLPGPLMTTAFRAILAPSFADIFFNNCFKNGLLPIVLDKAIISALFDEVEASEGYQLEVDLEQQLITKPDGSSIPFVVDEFRKHCLLNGLDDIGLTLKDAEKIRSFEDNWRNSAPWYFTTTNATTT